MVKIIENERRDQSVAVMIDRDQVSQGALKWAVDNLLTPGETLTLVHPKFKPSLAINGTNPNKYIDDTKEFFLPFRCFCTRKDINVEEVVLNDVEAVKGMINYVKENRIHILVLGASKMTLLKRFKGTDVTSAVMKGIPSFCTVYAISKGKISSSKSATSSPPLVRKIRQIPHPNNNNSTGRPTTIQKHDEIDIKYKYTFLKREYEDQGSVTNSEISYASSDRRSMDLMYPTPHVSISSDHFDENRCSIETLAKKSVDFGSSCSIFSLSGSFSSMSLHSHDEIEAEMRKLKLELKHTMEMYKAARKEAIKAKTMTNMLHEWKVGREHRLQEAKHC